MLDFGAMNKVILSLALAGILVACGTDNNNEDPWLWLEEVHGEAALAWAEERNAESLGHLESLPVYQQLFDRNLEIYNSDERYASPGIRGDSIHNFWRDAANIRGLWRQTTLDDYVSGAPTWSTILDLDELAEAEGEDWVWKGATCLRPEFRRCLLRLSRGGTDAVVVREFDVAEKRFIDDGFVIPESKVTVGWMDENTVFVGTDFGDDSLTDSGYPRTSRLWHRGEPLEESSEVWAGEREDVSVAVYRAWDGDRHYDVAQRTPSFFEFERYLFSETGDHKRIDIPLTSAFHGLVQGQLIVEIKEDWQPAETVYPQGALLSINFDRFMEGDRNFQVVVAPGERTAIPRGAVAVTRDYLIVKQLEDVVSTVTRFEFTDGVWSGKPVDVEGNGTINFVSTSDTSNIIFYSYTSYTQPTTLYVADDGGMRSQKLYALPEFYDASGVRVEQRFTTSADGTEVPYFIVFPKGYENDGKAPTMLYAYGGFQISQTPRYSATVGHAWLERGGVYVIANIRGGGEYGPAWHRAALKEHRQRAYDDLIAVAEHLIDSGVTSPRHLGVRGGSNGGLLTGVMMTQRPDLFGAVVSNVPLLDMKRYSHLLAGASWMAEYGNPDTDDWDYIKEYSPYQNISRDADYPKALFTTSTRDDRVHPGHARKMVARLLEYGHDVHYYENIVGGHAGATNNEQSAHLQALIYTYLWDQLAE